MYFVRSDNCGTEKKMAQKMNVCSSSRAVKNSQCVRSSPQSVKVIKTKSLSHATTSRPRVFVPHRQLSGIRAAKDIKATADSLGDTETLAGVVFRPFQEVQSQLATVTNTNNNTNTTSLARQNFSDACESALNDQINVEFNVSYVYHALHAYFDRDYIGLPGMAKYFKSQSHEEREHAELLMEYLNKRGGKVKLQSIMMPDMEFAGSASGDALYAMELTLSLEKLVNEKLLSLHKTAEDSCDPQMTDFIEGNFLDEQVAAIKEVSTMVSQLRRVGQGHGVYHFDLQLQ